MVCAFASRRHRGSFHLDDAVKKRHKDGRPGQLARRTDNSTAGHR
jgi:hypothetical protein